MMSLTLNLPLVVRKSIYVCAQLSFALTVVLTLAIAVKDGSKSAMHNVRMIVVITDFFM
jgi:hypothetical protein